MRKSCVFFLLFFTMFLSTAYTQSVVDYFPLEVGNYWIYDEYKIGEDGSRFESRTLKQIIEGIDTINGKEYYRMKQHFEFYNNDTHDVYLWLNVEKPGIMIGAMGNLPDVESAETHDNIGLLPNEFFTPKKLKASNIALNTPAGQFDNCVKVAYEFYEGNIYEYYAPGIGRIMREGGKPEITYRSELIEYHINVQTGVSESMDIPEKVLLMQNYPNPFNAETLIEFYIPDTEYVEIIVYNVAGQKVRTLLSEKTFAGTQSVHWDGKNDVGDSMSSGVYLIYLRTGTSKLFRPMSFIK